MNILAIKILSFWGDITLRQKSEHIQTIQDI